MIDASATGGQLTAPTGWVRLRTLVTLRWFAIAGQVAALLVASRVYELDLPLGAAFTIIAAAAIANLALMMSFPESRRLSEGEAIVVIGFDLVQLGALLSLTGGLHNPFALLILAPVTIAATVLPLSRTIAVGAGALVLATALGLWHLPLRDQEGHILSIPPLFVLGFWVAIVTGVAFSGFYARRVTSEMQTMSEALLAAQMALAREQKLTDLGGVVAAAAHELGTPLATIKLVAAELAEDLEDPAQREDAALIASQADRCRDILRSMGRAGKEDRHMRRAPLGTVLREAAEPHSDRGPRVNFFLAPMGGSPSAEDDPRQPQIRRSPEIVHGLRNLIQNAVDFARGAVWVEARWSQAEIVVTITDDGPGYPASILGRIGEPFLVRGPSPGEGSGERRAGYEGMGMGLFIAKTLLERTGGRLTFANAGDPFGPKRRAAPKLGARVSVAWPRAELQDARAPLGENARFEP
jgi:two-component system sensor histidine kinase RegB